MKTALVLRQSAQFGEFTHIPPLPTANPSSGIANLSTIAAILELYYCNQRTGGAGFLRGRFEEAETRALRIAAHDWLDSYSVASALMSFEPGKPQTVTLAMNQIVDAKVLFVEDEETLRHAVAKMLERRGFSVIEAREGRTAIDILRRNRSHIGVVLLDIKLPDVGGVDVFSDMCLIDPAIKVILTTGSNVRIAAASAGERRPWGLIQKPYEIDELASLLRSALAA